MPVTAMCFGGLAFRENHFLRHCYCYFWSSSGKTEAGAMKHHGTEGIGKPDDNMKQELALRSYAGWLWVGFWQQRRSWRRPWFSCLGNGIIPVTIYVLIGRWRRPTSTSCTATSRTESRNLDTTSRVARCGEGTVYVSLMWNRKTLPAGALSHFYGNK